MGLEATRRIVKALPQAEVLIISQYESPQAIRAAQEAGARGYLPKCHAGKHLIFSIEYGFQSPALFPFVSAGLAPTSSKSIDYCSRETRSRLLRMAYITSWLTEWKFSLRIIFER